MSSTDTARERFDPAAGACDELASRGGKTKDPVLLDPSELEPSLWTGPQTT